MVYLQLLWSFFQIGLFSIGGGYAAMPLIQQQVTENHSWLTLTQFADIMAIAEMTPGPIAINSATFVGIRVAGIPGALVATFGCVLPSCVIVTLLAWVYYRYKGLSLVQDMLACLRPAVVAMIASAGISLFILALFGQGGGLVDLNYVAAVVFIGAERGGAAAAEKAQSHLDNGRFRRALYGYKSAAGYLQGSIKMLQCT